MRPEFKIWTIGHSTRPLGEFLDLLTVNDIEALADAIRVRAVIRNLMPTRFRDLLLKSGSTTNRSSSSAEGADHGQIPQTRFGEAPHFAVMRTIWKLRNL